MPGQTMTINDEGALRRLGTAEPMRVFWPQTSHLFIIVQDEERDVPSDTPHQGGLAASLLFNVSAWAAVVMVGARLMPRTGPARTFLRHCTGCIVEGSAGPDTLHLLSG